MIHVTNSRVNGGPPHITEQDKPGPRAFTSLVQYELGYGGRAIEVEPARVVVQTRVMDTVDTVTFSGPEDEMRPLYTVAALHSLVLRQQREAIVQNAADQSVQLNLSPLLLSMSAGFLTGIPSTKAAVLTFLQVPVDWLTDLAPTSLEDLCAVAEVFITEGEPALSLLRS